MKEMPRMLRSLVGALAGIIVLMVVVVLVPQITSTTYLQAESEMGRTVVQVIKTTKDPHNEPSPSNLTTSHRPASVSSNEVAATQRGRSVMKVLMVESSLTT